MADNICYGVMAQMADGSKEKITADYTMLACGGLGGIYKHSTNYRHITGDALAIAKNHGIRLEHIDYIQIHPTTLYSEKPGRRFLISESVRGEGAILLNKEGNRFVNELLPRDLLTKEVHKQMAIVDGTDSKRNDHQPFSKHLQTLSGRGLRLHERANSCCSGTALFYGWYLG